MRATSAALLLVLAAAPLALAEDPPATPPAPVRRKPIEPRRFEPGKLTDPYWGAVFAAEGLEQKPGERQVGRLFEGKAGRVQIDVGIWEFNDERTAPERRAETLKGWAAKKREQNDLTQGDDPAPWVTFTEKSPAGSLRRHGYAWFVRGCRSFVVHTNVAADAEGAIEAVKAPLFGLTLGPETGAAVLVEAESRRREMPYDDAGVLAATGGQYLQKGPGVVPRPAIAETLLRRAIEVLPGSALERNPSSVMQVWRSFAIALTSLGRHDEAIAAATKTVELADKTDAPGPDGAMSRFNLACALSCAAKVDQAFEQLALAFAKFPPVTDQALAADEDLANCRADPRWAKFLADRPAKK